MKPIVSTVLSLILVAGIGCSTTHTGNRMVSFDHDRPGKYKGKNPLTSSIMGIIKDEADNRPVPDAVVELYNDDRMTSTVAKSLTGPRGRFVFTVKEGVYFIVISHPKFKEARLVVPVKGGDADLNEVRLSRFFD